MKKRKARITLSIEDARWRDIDVKLVRSAVARTLARTGCEGELTLLLSSDDRLCALNARYRGKCRPTNVLSFPARDVAGYLGDVAIGFGVAQKEAAGSGRLLTHHAAHLAVHGVLHLLGYDHGKAREARVMEGLEAAILAEMGIADPYRTAAE